MCVQPTEEKSLERSKLSSLYKKSNTIYCFGCNHQATAVQRNKTALK